MVDRRFAGILSLLVLAGCPDDGGGDTSTSFGGTTMPMATTTGSTDTESAESTSSGGDEESSSGSSSTGMPDAESSSSSGGGSCSVDMHEPNDDSASARSADIGDSINGIMCEGDVDWFTFSNPALASVAIDLMFMVGEGDLDVYLLDDTLAEVGSSTGTSGLEAIHGEIEAGTYYIRVDLGTPQGTPMDINYTLAIYSF